MSLSEQLDAVRTERARQFKRARVDDDGPGAGQVVGGGIKIVVQCHGRV